VGQGSSLPKTEPLSVRRGYHDLFSDPTAEDTVQFTVDYIKKRIAAK
jgi:hypothetical protein